MSRPHEDRERHTLVDHRPGGTPAAFTVGSRLAIGIARVKADRIDACVSAYETLIEKAQTSNVHAGPSAVLASKDGRRMVALVGVHGHEGFRHLAAAWDDRHRNAQHRVISESVSFALYEVTAGAMEIDPASHDAYVYERLERPAEFTSELFASLDASLEFHGAAILSGDGATASAIATVIVSRFAHFADYEAFRTSRAAIDALGKAGASGDSSFAMHPHKSFASLSSR